MNKLAIDVVLLPSEKMMEHTIAVNRELIRENPPKIVLDKTSCLPHISLVMGCITENDLPQLNATITDIAGYVAVFNLSIAAAKAEPMPDGKQVTVLNLVPDPRLRNLHETLINRLQAFLSYDATPEMLYSPPEVEEISLPFINNFLKHSSFHRFSPHITAGIGAYQPSSMYPLSFTSATLAVYQLGNYCTCRKLLHAVTLKNE